MKISTKGRYALRMLTDLAILQGDGFVSLKGIAERQGVSQKYLEQIVPLLNKRGILRTNRGNKGGYMLAKRAEELTVGEVLRATEGSLAPVACLELETNDCPNVAQCPTLYVWQGLFDAITQYLDSITVQDIIDRSSSGENNYCI